MCWIIKQGEPTMSLFKLPDLGEGLPDAEINQWHVKTGDVIEADEPMVAMETAKAIVDVPAPYKGTVIKLHGNIGDIIKTGEILLELLPIESAEKKSHDTGTVAGTIETTDDIRPEPNYALPTKNTYAHNHSVSFQASPAAIQLARALNIDLTTLTPKNNQQKITVKDIRALVPENTLTSVNGSPLKGTRRTMAHLMSKAQAEIVPVSIFDQTIIQQKKDITTQVIHAIHTACQKEPSLNAWFDGTNKEILKEIHLGLAVDTKDGLFVPVIKNLIAYLKNNSQTLREKINDIKEQVKSRELSAQDLSKPSITLSNFGMFSGRHATPIIIPPQVAIIGCGQLHQQVVPINQKITIAWILPLSLTFDHRAVTGGEATRFLKSLIQTLSAQS